MKANNIQDSQIADDPPLPTFWGEICNFFTSLPDRWDPDKRLGYVDRSTERPGSTTDFGKSSVDDDFSVFNGEDTSIIDKTDDSKAMGLGWPFFNESMGFSYMDDEFSCHQWSFPR
jgi:hypothetical protein